MLKELIKIIIELFKPRLKISSEKVQYDYLITLYNSVKGCSRIDEVVRIENIYDAYKREFYIHEQFSEVANSIDDSIDDKIKFFKILDLEKEIKKVEKNG